MSNIFEEFVSKPLVRKESSAAEIVDLWTKLKGLYWECSDSVSDDDQQVFDGISRILEDSFRMPIPEGAPPGCVDPYYGILNYDAVVEQLAYVEDEMQLNAVVNFLKSMFPINLQRKFRQDLHNKQKRIDIEEEKDNIEDNTMVFKNCKIGNIGNIGSIGKIVNVDGNNYCDDNVKSEHQPVPQSTETAELTETRTVKVTRSASNGNAGNKNNGIVVTNSQFEDKVLELLDTLMAGKTNKDAATIINGALSAGAILKPTHGEFCVRYGVDILSEKLFYKYVGLDKMAITKEEIEPIKDMFKKLLS